VTWEPCPERGRGAEQTTDGRFISFRCRDRRRLVYAVSRRGQPVWLGLFRTSREARRAAEAWRRQLTDDARALLVTTWFERESRETWERLERTRPRLFPRNPVLVGPAVGLKSGAMLYHVM